MRWKGTAKLALQGKAELELKRELSRDAAKASNSLAWRGFVFRTNAADKARSLLLELLRRHLGRLYAEKGREQLPSLCLTDILVGVRMAGHPIPSLNDYFADKVCINLARRSDRWVTVQEEFRRHGLHSIRRFEGCDGASALLPPGWDYGAGSWGCLRSHFEVVRAAREAQLASILILEDDVEFHPDLNTLFPQYAEQIPPDWDALLFGGMHLAPPEPVSPNIVRLQKTSSTFAWAMRNTLYDAFLDINRETMIAVDENNHALQQSFRFYGLMPHLAWVKRDHSDVMAAEVNPWWIRHSVVLFGPEQERTLRDMGAIVFFDSSSFHDRTEAEEALPLLQSVLRLYMVLMEENAICVVERGEQALLRTSDLPARCVYRLFTPASSPVECARFAAAALPGRQYFVCAPYDVYPLRTELRATLLCCPQYDIVTPLHQPLPLNDEDTQKMLRDDPSTLNTGLYPSLPADTPTADFCIVAARLLQDKPHSRTDILTASLLERSRVFRSPGRLVRLKHRPKTMGMAAD